MSANWLPRPASMRLEIDLPETLTIEDCDRILAQINSAISFWRDSSKAMCADIVVAVRSALLEKAE